MKNHIAMCGMTAALLFSANTVRAEDKEPSAIIELGGMGEWNVPKGRPVSFGPSAGIEFSVIKDWLEIETSVSTVFRRGHTEYGTDFLFRKPFTLSDKVEFMLGVGPAMTYTTGENGAKFAGVVALDFMFWPSGEKTFGWFLEPAYSYSFHRGHEKSLGVTVGLLIGIPCAAPNSFSLIQRNPLPTDPLACGLGSHWSRLMRPKLGRHQGRVPGHGESQWPMT